MLYVLESSSGKRYVSITNIGDRKLEEHKRKNKGGKLLATNSFHFTPKNSPIIILLEKEKNILKSGIGRKWIDVLKESDEVGQKWVNCNDLTKEIFIPNL